MAQIYYNTLTRLKEALLEDVNVNTVTTGTFDRIDTAKATMFPLTHFDITNISYLSNIYTLTINMSCMDIVDISKDLTDNEEDVLNTQMAVITKLFERLTKGDLSDELYELIGVASCDKGTEQYENFLSGWACTFTIQVPNLDIGIC
jgi:hypothetical protein